MATQDQQNNNSIPTSRQSLESNLPQQTFKIRGMKHDLSESSFENDFAFENMNMRINIVDNDNTLINLTNERGTSKICSLSGIPIGCKKYANNKILLLTTEDGISSTKDHIYNIEIDDNDSISVTELSCESNTYGKNYGFDSKHPAEIEHFHDGDKNFFYIADGINNLKSFWIENNKLYPSVNDLNYNKEVNGSEAILIQEICSNTAEFFSGVIMYCFCYITRQGHKTNVIDITDVIPISNYGYNQGLEPNKRTNTAYKVGVFKLADFDKVEIYSLFRSSLNGEITIRKVTNKEIKFASLLIDDILSYKDGEKILTSSEISSMLVDTNYVEVIDENKGDIISYQELLTRFNSVLIPSTLAIKNSALFLGNIKTDNFTNLKTLLKNGGLGGYYTINKSSYTNNYFYSKNKYYAGLQFQDKYGNWSPVVEVGEIKYHQNIELNTNCVNTLLNNGYIAVRAMMLDNVRIHNSICEGFGIRTYSIENGKYGVDYYAGYADNLNNALFKADTVTVVSLNEKHQGYSINHENYWDIYSPDVEFNENFYIDKSISYKEEHNVLDYDSNNPKIEITISGNTGVLFNNSDQKVGKPAYENGFFIWYDAISKYQEALQLQFGDGESLNENNQDSIHLTPLFKLSNYNLYEEVSKYRIYVWQPSGSLNDSDGKTSVLNTKKIGWYLKNLDFSDQSYPYTSSSNIFMFDGTTNIIPLSTDGKTYGGILNQKLYQKTWQVELLSNHDGSYPYFDYNQTIFNDYARSFLTSNIFVGQPIEILRETGNTLFSQYLIDYSAHNKILDDDVDVESDAIVHYWNNTTIEQLQWNNQELIWNDTTLDNQNKGALPILSSNSFTRKNQISITYKTNRHLVLPLTNVTDNKLVKCIISYTNEQDINNVDIERGQWIVCSRKQKLSQNNALVLDVNLNDVYTWSNTNNYYYEPLISEPYSDYDTNQVCCLVRTQGIHSYINPKCRYDKFVGSTNPIPLSSEFYNKINPVYNQKNNFFIFSGITPETITDDSLDNTILYSDTKVNNEKEDTFINFSTTNFYTIDSNINTINKIITYNDKLLCFSDDAIVQILYNENVVINTDSVQSLGLASTDKVTGTQLITNTYGCLNKWSIGIFNNDLYFIDDLNNKLIAYNGDFVALNEQLGIETLNNKIIKNKVWNPNEWSNTKFNIDKFAKDVHYTANDFDIAFNSEIGAFTSLYSYEKISYIETIGNHTIAFKYNNSNTDAVFLREGLYNKFFGYYKPYYTTVILNQNSLVNKMLSNIEYSSEAYSVLGSILTPEHNFTFNYYEVFNDYQNTQKIKINYKLYGQSLLKKKFRVWRINRFRNYSRLSHKNYDLMSNTWHYLKLLTDGPELERNIKLTFHWLNVKYR